VLDGASLIGICKERGAVVNGLRLAFLQPWCPTGAGKARRGIANMNLRDRSDSAPNDHHHHCVGQGGRPSINLVYPQSKSQRELT
jgi:hypothetical protein